MIFLLSMKLKQSISTQIYIFNTYLQLSIIIYFSYPNYEFIHQDKKYTKLAVRYWKYNTLSLFHGLLVDLTILSQSEYVICTHSSNIGRLLFEYMYSENRLEDAYLRLKSLDANYYFVGTRTKIATKEHLAIIDEKSNEIDLKIGDVIYQFESLWNGYIKGKNMRTNKTGLFPSYKTMNYEVMNVETIDVSKIHKF